ncbi:MAG: tRNA glutamyl-Q(34) synthetase GluQRS [Porticoccaceae bacterium]|nr:tRNA glutamyl-Q(34) synthetase GluQRS [Porticoccaceae bacterium]
MTNAKYIGRFAPSPTGTLHFGSLVCALASFLDARHQSGRWLLRIEDIDPPREIAGSTTTILRQLSDHGLSWDGEILYQSTRTEAYREAIAALQSADIAYNCDCPRQRLTALGGIYDGHCRQRKVIEKPAIRLQVPTESGARESEATIRFDDLIMGHYIQNLCSEIGDFIIQRRDLLFSYQLAVAVDDQFQNISHIIRGVDLIYSTPRQIYLQKCLTSLSGDKPPTLTYGHLPMAINAEGQKLSKQNHAAALEVGKESQNLWLALQWLGQQPPDQLKNEPINRILDWAIDNWSISRISKQLSIPAPDQY